MSNTIEYKDIIAFHPGYYVEDIIEELGISQAEFALRMGTTPKTLSQLVNGRINISNDLAKKLSMMLGSSVDGWLNLQKKYDEKLIEIQREKDLGQQKEIVSLIDYAYFEDVCHLEKTNDKIERINNLCKYFMVSNLRILLEPDFLASFRGDINNDKKKVVNSKAWLQVAINFSKKIETKPYNQKKLKDYLPELRGMTLQEPDVFLPRMKEIFSECGVAFVLIPHLKDSGVNGAIKWINNERVILALNNRGLDADRFWFALFHEIKHIFQRKIKTVFISSSNQLNMDKELELEADKFAADYLIPEKCLKEFAPTKNTTDEEIVEFANSIKIHPGVVVGRLQHDKIISKNRSLQLKELYVLYR